MIRPVIQSPITVTAASSPARRRAAGFTLIEMLVVIVIIMILLGIGIAYGPSMLAPSQESETRTTMSNLQAVNDEYETRTGGVIDANTINQFVQKATGGTNIQLGTQEPFRTMLSSFSDKVLRHADPSNTNTNLEVYDAWGKAIAYVTPTQWAANAYVDSDGNGSPDLYLRNLPQKSFAYFASAGPDGQWGNVTATQSSSSFKQTRDNVYSFDRK